jgi:multiple sugar transport system ATP-binding protein
MGRAIVREPAAFLMDEPLSNLDAKLRVSMRAELSRLHSRLGITTVYVTHDQVEAMTLGERVAVMRDGRIQQVDAPQALYHEPANLFVAAFIGSPAMNLVEAVLDADAVEFANIRVPLPADRRPVAGSPATVILGLRPEDLEDAAFAEPGWPQFDATVAVVEELGSDVHLIFPIDAPRVEAEELKAAVDDEDDTLLADEQAQFNARVDTRTKARVGEPIRIAVNPARLHFFDPHSGASLLAPAQAAIPARA